MVVAVRDVEITLRIHGHGVRTGKPGGRSRSAVAGESLRRATRRSDARDGGNDSRAVYLANRIRDGVRDENVSRCVDSDAVRSELSFHRGPAVAIVSSKTAV